MGQAWVNMQETPITSASRGIRVGFNTNATLLTRARAERLVVAGLDWLCISLDGATAATYESIRDGAPPLPGHPAVRISEGGPRNPALAERPGHDGMLEEGLDLTPIITHRLPLSEYARAFDLVASGHAGKIVLLPQEG